MRTQEDHPSPCPLRDITWRDFLKWQWERLRKRVPGPGAYRFPPGRNDPAFLRANRTHTTLTWIGHATVLLQLGGRNVLTDPIFSPRASPLSWAGPRRAMPPGVSLDDLPPIDIVVISHDHYDSLDLPSLRRLRTREGGGKTTFFTPLGFRPWFARLGIDRVEEVAWWQRREADGLSVTAVPAEHWSKRGLFERNRRGWGGWVVEAGDFRFYFAGDTGYSPLFKEIGERLGPFALAAIPIGAYEPRWFMRRHHVDPEEAILIHRDVGSRLSVAIHWGTFVLTDEPLDEPPRRLKRAAREQALSPGAFRVLRHGETLLLEESETHPGARRGEAASGTGEGGTKP